MTNGLRIKQVAEASGFTAATLRYYEQIGLLPASTRTAAGYRVYDQRTLDQLAFIARAKQLGCSLDEITDLTAAWAGGRCGPIQDRLREVVADKIAAAHGQIAELVTFTSELEQAAASLERHRPDGACDDSCGCVGAAEGAADEGVVAQAVALSSAPVAPGAAIACTLSAGSVKGRVGDWRSLLTHVVERERIDGGVRSVFASSVPADELIRLVAAEHDCCQFFRFAITVDDRGVALEVRAPEGARAVVESMFGAPA